MENFKQDLKVNIEGNNNIYHEKSFEEKIADSIYLAILDVPVSNQEEFSRRSSYLYNLNKIVYNYDITMATLRINLGQIFNSCEPKFK